MHQSHPALLAALALTIGCISDSTSGVPSEVYAGIDASETPSDGGSDSDAPNAPLEANVYDLAFEATGYERHEGATISAVLLDDAGTVTASTIVTVQDGGFLLTFADALTARQSYELAWFVDGDDDLDCDGGLEDVARSFELTDVRTHQALQHHADDLTPAPLCDFFPRAAPYDLDIYGDSRSEAGLPDLHGADLVLAVRTRDYDEIVRDLVPLVDGVASPGYDDLLDAGTTYIVELYVDANQDGLCDAPPVDLGWRVTTGLVDGDIQLSRAFQGELTDVCGSIFD